MIHLSDMKLQKATARRTGRRVHMGNSDELVLFLRERGLDVRQVDCPTDFRLELVDLCAVCL